MREWRRADVLMLCGCCANGIPKGDPVLIIQATYLDIQTPEKRRCSKCADEPAPAELPELAERMPIQPTKKKPTVLPFKAWAEMQKQDWQRKASNDK